MQIPLEICLKPSRIFLLLLVVLLLTCLAAIVMVWIQSASSVVPLSALLCLLCLAWDAYRRFYLLRAKSSVIAVRLSESGWSLQTANQDWHTATLVGHHSTMTASLICLSFKLDRAQHCPKILLQPSVCLFNDSADAELMRLLRVALRNESSEKQELRRKHGVFGARS